MTQQIIQQNFQTYLFYSLSVLSIALALGVVFLKRIMRAVLALLGLLLLSAGFYLMLGSEFLAGVQVLVYIGGIVVLVVFAVMLTGAGQTVKSQPVSWLRKANALVTALMFFLISLWCLRHTTFPESPKESPLIDSEVKAIGLLLLSPGSEGYLLPFELISILLLAVLIAAVVISRKEDGKDL